MFAISKTIVGVSAKCIFSMCIMTIKLNMYKRSKTWRATHNLVGYLWPAGHIFDMPALSALNEDKKRDKGKKRFENLCLFNGCRLKVNRSSIWDAETIFNKFFYWRHRPKNQEELSRSFVLIDGIYTSQSETIDDTSWTRWSDQSLSRFMIRGDVLLPTFFDWVSRSLGCLLSSREWIRNRKRAPTN